MAAGPWNPALGKRDFTLAGAEGRWDAGRRNPAEIDPAADLAEQLDIDSIDFLNLVVAVAYLAAAQPA